MDRRKVLISIIVPVYNADKYLNKCVDSILSQTISDFELILINDGSRDGSTSILDEYKKQDPRVVVIHKPNGGVSSARNVGIEVSRGEYILFVDSDDYIATDYIQTMLKYNSSYEWVFSGIRDFAADRADIPFIYPDSTYNLNKENDYFEFINLGLFNAPFPKLYITSIIKENSLRFNTEISFAEDREFNLHYMQYVSRLRTIPYIGYNYRGDTPGSLAKTAIRNQVSFDCDQWKLEYLNIKKRGFQKMDAYVYTHLFNILSDSLHRFGLNALNEVDFQYFVFIKEHLDQVEAPLWQKWLLCHRCFCILSLIYKLR